mgnify:FL=1
MTTNPYSLTGLTPFTGYDVYLQADCGTDLSAFAGPTSFTTAFQCPPNAVCATYSSDDISTDRGFTGLPGSSTCPGSISVVIPSGSVLDSVETF